MGAAYWVCAVVTLVSALTSAGFSVAACRDPRAGGHVPALYALSRSIAALVLAVVPLVHQSVEWLAAAAVAMILVQAGDVVVGRVQRDAMKTFGPAALAVLNLAALVVFHWRN